MARQKLTMGEINIAERAEAIGRGAGPSKEAPDPKKLTTDPKIGVGGMAKRFELTSSGAGHRIELGTDSWSRDSWLLLNPRLFGRFP